MLVVQIIGGLGNQMFQYAAARALAKSSGQDLVLDISGFDGYALHQGFELFGLFEGPPRASRIASPADLRQVLGWMALKPVQRLLMRHPLAWLRPQSLILEPHFEFWPGFRLLSATGLGGGRHAYLSGYWQSEKYFSDIEAVIRDEFQFRPAMSAENACLIDRMDSANAISLHVRRGDYVQNPATLSVHGICSVEYYQTAIQYLLQRVPNSHFFVFSDDIPWVRRHLPIHAPHTYVDRNQGAESFNDMRLMSHCRHHIAANSSFSWWGAWLNSQSKKIVTVPKNWFAQPKNTRDLIPDNWVRL